MRSNVPSMITNAFRPATVTASRSVGASAARASRAFADVAEHRGRADREPGGQVGVGLALPQMRHHEQGLLVSGEPAPAGAHHRASVPQSI
jgi:hypothetical protein